MPYRIVSPPNSFVRFSDQHLDDVDWYEHPLPGAGLSFALPVCAEDDLAYQFIIEGDTREEGDLICAILTSDIYFKIAPGAGLGPALTNTEFTDIPTGAQPGEPLGVEKYRLNDTQVLFYVPKLTALPFTNIDCGSCFQIALKILLMPDTLFGISNVFTYRCDTDYTTVLDYDSDQDEAGFTYCVSPTIHNRVRLPLYLTRPTYPEEETNYRTSGGATTVVKASVRKSFEVVSDSMPAWALEALRAIWLHKPVSTSVSSSVTGQVLPYTGELVKDGAFEIDYVDYLNYPLGKAKFKVVASPFLMRKNNCGECIDYSYLLGVSDYTIPGALLTSTNYTIDLMTLVDASCCSPLSFTVVYTNYSRVASSSITNGSGLSPFGVLTLLTTTSLGLFGANKLLLRIEAKCGGIIKYINIFRS